MTQYENPCQNRKLLLNVIIYNTLPNKKRNINLKFPKQHYCDHNKIVQRYNNCTKLNKMKQCGVVNS